MDGRAKRRGHAPLCATTLATLAAAVLAGWAPGTSNRPVAAAGANSSGGLAAPARLWVDDGGNWVHQHATVYNVHLAVPASRLRRALERAVGAWNRSQRLEVRVVDRPEQANVIVAVERYGRGRVPAWTKVYPDRGRAFTYFNLDQLRRRYWAARTSGLACHEIGHVVGLGHGGRDCMAFTYYPHHTYGVSADSLRLVDRAYANVPSGPPRWLAGGTIGP